VLLVSQADEGAVASAAKEEEEDAERVVEAAGTAEKRLLSAARASAMPARVGASNGAVGG
jgi:hypothetical protein